MLSFSLSLSSIACAVLGWYLFTTGFFLSRQLVSRHSDCSFPPTSYAYLHSFASNISSHDSSLFLSFVQEHQQQIDALNYATHCWSPSPRYSQTILLLIDALRFDFASSRASYDERDASQTTSFTAQFPILEQLTQSVPKQARLYEFLADSPTLTTERIKAFMTGGLPTFINFRHSFDGKQVEEDNILLQLKSAKKHSIMMGDDTWLNLYPTHFDIAYPYPSFNVKDLDTVDDGCIKHLLPEIQKNNFTFLLSHFLGVDHVGHRYQDSHPEMKRKLNQMNQVVKEVIQQMNNDTLLIVMGDHGMTPDGSHGGATTHEINSALFFYSKQMLFPLSSSSSDIRPKALNQIDLVPTLSLLLNLPIPFSNLGRIVEDVFASESRLFLLYYLRLNTYQIVNYLITYQNETSNGFPPHLIHQILDEFVQLEKQVIQHVSSDEHVNKYPLEYRHILTLCLNLCRQEWNTFNSIRMISGLLFCFLSWILLLFLISRFPISSASSFVYLYLGLLVVYGQGMFSDSYVQHEMSLLYFLFQSFLLISWTQHVQQQPDLFYEYSKYYLLMIGTLRLSGDGQQIGPSLVLSSHYFSSLLFVQIVFSLLFLSYLTYRLSYSLLPSLSFALVWIHWTFEAYNELHPDQAYETDQLPLLVYLVFFLQLPFSLSFRQSLSNLLPLCLLVCGPSSSFVYLMLVLCSISYYQIVHLSSHKESFSSVLSLTLFFFFLCQLTFFLTGHQNTFGSLHPQAAFIGFKQFNFYISGTLMALNTFNCYLLLFLVFPIFFDSFSLSNLSLGYSLFLLFALSKTLCTTLNAQINKRHLMLWQVFAPKYTFDIITFGITCVGMGTTYLIAYLTKSRLTQSNPSHSKLH